MQIVRFHKIYAIIFLILLAAEILIALYVKGFVRDTIGDVLVIILIYCFIRAFFNLNKTKTIIGILIFAFLVEIAQAFNISEALNANNNPVVATILGSTFDKFDLIAYLAGGLIVYGIESVLSSSGRFNS